MHAGPRTGRRHERVTAASRDHRRAPALRAHRGFLLRRAERAAAFRHRPRPTAEGADRHARSVPRRQHRATGVLADADRLVQGRLDPRLAHPPRHEDPVRPPAARDARRGDANLRW